MKQLRLFIAFAFVVLLSFTFDNSEAMSPVAISIDDNSYEKVIFEDDYIFESFTIQNDDNIYRKMEVNLNAIWLENVNWSFMWLDMNGDNIEDNTVTLTVQGEMTVMLAIFCDGNCKAGDSTTIQIFGKTDPKFYAADYDDPSNHTDTCGSDDCVNDTSPASESANITNSIQLSLTAWAEYSFDLDINQSSLSKKDNVFNWNYTITNTGFSWDSYNFSFEFYNETGASLDSYFNVLQPVANPITTINSQFSLNLGYNNVYESNIRFNHSLSLLPSDYFFTLYIFSTRDPSLSKSVTVNFTTDKDSDEDGIYDSSDKCSDTVSGALVDSEGCSDSQRDSDEDGISDALDNCSDTVSGDLVDSDGCSDSQRDSDEDGISDASDKCSDTVSGDLVDSDGCSYSQNDLDNDGVTNDKDACFSLEGDVVDENGCKLENVEGNDNTTSDLDNVDDSEEVSSLSLMSALVCVSLLSVIHRRFNH
tara:strand:+ start:941 stop:2371 length:1431 start_codon:yes stop_codon:yes gene_type:complete